MEARGVAGKSKRKNIGKCKVLSSPQSMGPLYVASVSMKWRVRFIFSILFTQYMWQGGGDSLTGVGTRYWIDGLGLEFRWGQDFSDQSKPAPKPTQTHAKWMPGLFFEGKAAEAWRWPLARLQRRGREWVELYLYLLSFPPCLLGMYRDTFTLTCDTACLEAMEKRSALSNVGWNGYVSGL